MLTNEPSDARSMRRNIEMVEAKTFPAGGFAPRLKSKELNGSV